MFFWVPMIFFFLVWGRAGGHWMIPFCMSYAAVFEATVEDVFLLLSCVLESLFFRCLLLCPSAFFPQHVHVII